MQPKDGHAVKLHIKTELGGFSKVELTIDGRPIKALLQAIKLELDAETAIPRLSLSLVPTDLELDLDAAVVELLTPEIRPLYCLTKPDIPLYAKRLPANNIEIDEALVAYREAFPK